MAAGRVIAESRDALIIDWSRRVEDKLAATGMIPRRFVEREFRLLVDLAGQSVGPFRREVMPIWIRACEQYGRVGSMRGLAAGEVVEELQHLRDILTLRLAPIVTTLQPLTEFWPAEDYHKQYYEHHKDAAYCQLVINPKLQKLKEKFAELLKGSAV